MKFEQLSYKRISYSILLLQGNVSSREMVCVHEFAMPAFCKMEAMAIRLSEEDPVWFFLVSLAELGNVLWKAHELTGLVRMITTRLQRHKRRMRGRA